MTFAKLSKKQKKIFRWAYAPDAYAIICDGSVRSGKTAAMACSFVHWAMSQFDGECFGICGNTVNSAERNIVMEIMQMVDITHYYDVAYTRSGSHVMTVSGCGKVNKFHVFGGKDEASYKLVQGLTLAGVLFDEVALMPESFVNQAIARTLSVDGARLWFNCNPESPEHWFYKNWILKADNGERSDVLHLHFMMQDNPIMTPEKIKRSESMWQGVFYERYILGKWCVAEGIVYTMFDKQRHVVSNDVKLPPGGDYYISCDYGTRNPTSAGLWYLAPDGHATRLREYYYNGRKSEPRTDEEHCTALEQLAGDLIDDVNYIIIDPSAASFIECIRRRGVFRVRHADNSVLDGIRDTSTLLDLGYLHFCECCEDTIREFGLYRWDDKKPADAVIKENDHAMDDTRYFVRIAMRRILKRIRGDEEK